MPLGDMEHAANIIEIDTIGFLVGDFDDRLVVSASISDNEQCDGYIAIPREWVKEYWEITI